MNAIWYHSTVRLEECQKLLCILDDTKPCNKNKETRATPTNKDVTCVTLMRMATTAIGRAVAEIEGASSDLTEPAHYTIGRLFLSLRTRIADEEQAKVMTHVERALAET